VYDVKKLCLTSSLPKPLPLEIGKGKLLSEEMNIYQEFFSNEVISVHPDNQVT
jgi:hypothetical protein